MPRNARTAATCTRSICYWLFLISGLLSALVVRIEPAPSCLNRRICSAPSCSLRQRDAEGGGIGDAGPISKKECRPINATQRCSTFSHVHEIAVHSTGPVLKNIYHTLRRNSGTLSMPPNHAQLPAVNPISPNRAHCVRSHFN